MRTISDEHQIYSMSPDHPAQYQIKPGELVTVRTADCYHNRIKSVADDPSAIDFPPGNPATGPIAVEGARQGDTLKVTIHRVTPLGEATMFLHDGLGRLPHRIGHEEIFRFPMQDGKLRFAAGIELPLDPMVGVLGLAPESGEISNNDPGSHGGNLDTRLIRAGASIYLPVKVPGANLALGDVHAVMGDGEVAICGAETPADVELTVELIKERQERWPVLEDAESWYVLCSAKTLDAAADLATDAMFTLIRARTDKLTDHEIICLLSLAAHLEISQVVDPLMTVRMRLPKAVAGALFDRLF